MKRLIALALILALLSTPAYATVKSRAALEAEAAALFVPKNHITAAQILVVVNDFMDSAYNSLSDSWTGDVTSTGNVTTIKSSVALAGNPTTTTQAAGNSSTRIATTAFVANDKRCYDLYLTTPAGSVEPTGSNPPPAFKDFPFNFLITQIFLNVYSAGAQNVLANGSFAADAIWTKGAGWTIDTGNGWAAAVTSSAALTQTPSHAMTTGWTYHTTYTLSSVTGGSVVIAVGGTAGTARSANGTYSEDIVAGSGRTVTFTGTGFSGHLSAPSVYSYATFDVQNNGVSILGAGRLAIDNATNDSRLNVTNPQPTISLPTVVSGNTISVIVNKDDDQNAMAGGDMVICGSKL